MRITDIVTPQDIHEMYKQDFKEMRSLGQRDDLKIERYKKLADRLQLDYIYALEAVCYDKIEVIAIHRFLALLDRFLEEKYANTNTN